MVGRHSIWISRLHLIRIGKHGSKHNGSLCSKYATWMSRMIKDKQKTLTFPPAVTSRLVAVFISFTLSSLHTKPLTLKKKADPVNLRMGDYSTRYRPIRMGKLYGRGTIMLYARGIIVLHGRGTIWVPLERERIWNSVILEILRLSTNMLPKAKWMSKSWDMTWRLVALRNIMKAI